VGKASRPGRLVAWPPRLRKLLTGWGGVRMVRDPESMAR
jgi:hypothetical protein